MTRQLKGRVASSSPQGLAMVIRGEGVPPLRREAILASPLSRYEGYKGLAHAYGFA